MNLVAWRIVQVSYLFLVFCLMILLNSNSHCNLGPKQCISLTPIHVGIDPRLEFFCGLHPDDSKCCAGNQACSDIIATGPITICRGSCVGALSCNSMNLEAGATIEQRACVGASSCQGLRGSSVLIADDACVGAQSCQNAGSLQATTGTCLQKQACGLPDGRGTCGHAR